MRIPIIQGVIDRRILVNFRVRPETLRPLLPSPFRPKLVRGWAMAGICLIRLKQIRPRHLPAALGIGSENAAHRIAVEWDEKGERREGVFVVRRDSSSLFNTLAGGRLFPGVHHRARFDVRETNDSFFIELRSDDGATRLMVDAQTSDGLPDTSVFHSLQEASSFFEAGSTGYSPSRDERMLEGLELRSVEWKVEPLDVRRVESSFFSDPSRFGSGTAEFDNALLMRGIHHEWHACESICCEPLPAIGA